MTSEGDRYSTSPATLYTPLEQGSHVADEEPEQELTSEGAHTTPDMEDSTLEPELSPEEENRRELERRMRQVQEEISSLEMALGRKQRELAAIKKDLGITPLTQLKEDVKMGYEELKQSKAVQSTKEFFKNLGEKISSSDFYKSAQSAATTVGEKGGDALRAAGSKTSEAFGKAKMSMKENQTLQNIGGKIRSTSMSIKEKVSSSRFDASATAVSKSTADAEAKYDSEAALEQGE